MSPDGRFKTANEGGTFLSTTQEMKKLVDAGKASMGFALIQTHSPNTIPHKALICAHAQGKFWEAHDRLLSTDGYYTINPGENPNKTGDATAPTEESIATFLASVLDANTLTSCLKDPKTEEIFAKNQTYAQSLNLRGTPSMILNGKSVNWADYTTGVKPLVDEALK
jgi:protein-disulfide isomerase